MGQFIALVGPTGSGKTTLLSGLKKNFPSKRCVFLCDSNGSGNSPHVPFTTRVTEIAQEGIHEEATSRSQLLLFWSRLVNVIEHEVVPSLELGKNVFMDGFGGTVLTHALCHAKSAEERAELIELHKDMIKHCVLGLGAPPPKYLWLRPSPQVAYARLKKLGKLPRSGCPLAHIEAINEGFDFYSNLPGQTVIRIDADQSRPSVFKEALKHIDPIFLNVA